MNRNHTKLSHTDQNIGALNVQLHVVHQLNNTDQESFSKSDVMMLLTKAAQILKEKQERELTVEKEVEA